MSHDPGFSLLLTSHQHTGHGNRKLHKCSVADINRGRNDPAARAVRDVWDSGVITAPGAQLPQLPRLEEPAAQRPALA